MNTKEKIYQKRWMILFSVVIVTFMCCLDSSIVNVSLPVIAKNLDVSMSSIQWTITIYLLVIAGLILSCGRIGDIKGKSKIFRAGIIIFTIGSLLCSISSNVIFLIVSRGIQGLGAACAMSVGQGIITAVFTKEERGKALGVSSLIVALGTMIGPALGGIISEYRWQYIFLINIPIGIFAIFLAFEVLPDIDVETKLNKKLDYIGTILFIVAIVSLILSITEGSIYGYTNLYILIGYVIAIVFFILFILSQHKIESPVLNLSIFKNHKFSKGISTSFLLFVSVSAYTILLPFYYEDIRNISPSFTGILMMVFPIIVAITAPISGRLSDKMKREKLPFIGFIILAIGFFCLSTISVKTNIFYISLYLIIIGLGNGLVQPPMNAIVMSSVKKDKLGIAGSVNGLIRNLGMICGITFGTSLLYGLMSHKLGYVVKGVIKGKESVFVNSMDIVNLILAIICLVGAFIVLSMILNLTKKKIYRN